MLDIKTIGLNLLSNTIIIAIVGFLLKSMFERWMRKDLEDFKKEVALIVQKNSVVFSKLHEKRVEVISQLHAKLEILGETVNSINSTIDKLKERDKEIVISVGLIDELGERSDQFYDYFKLNKLFLPQELEVKLDDIYSYVFAIRMFLLFTNCNESVYSDMSIRLENAVKNFKKDKEYKFVEEAYNNIIYGLKDLSKEFRQILGSVDH